MFMELAASHDLSFGMVSIAVIFPRCILDVLVMFSSARSQAGTED